ncbi:MAG: peptidylprolyl isomerase [Bdellovibrionales bacterium]
MSIQVISFNCLLKNKAGRLISSTFNREVLSSCGNENAMLSGLSKALQNLKKGEKRTISLSAEQAYGLYDPQKIILFPKKKLPRHLRVGEMVTIVGKSGTARVYKVVQYYDDMVSLDGNHPLAGQDLIFEIEALDAREATPQEIDDSLNVLSSQLLH